MTTTTFSRYPDPILIEPDQEHRRSIIWLHGLGTSGYDFHSLVPSLSFPDKNRTRWIFPNAPTQPVTINHQVSMPSWFDIISLKPEPKWNSQDIKLSTDYILSLLRQEQSRLMNGEQVKIYLAGFSQGGVIALHAGLSSVKQQIVENLHILALSCCHLTLDVLIKESSTTQLLNMKKCPIMMMQGDYDDVITPDLAEQTYQILEHNGFNIQRKNYPMGHELCAQQIKDIANFLS